MADENEESLVGRAVSVVVCGRRFWGRVEAVAGGVATLREKRTEGLHFVDAAAVRVTRRK